MKKSGILLSVVVFMTIAWCGITYVVGSKAENYYFEMLEQSSQFGFVTFTNQNYERGFLQSKAETLMEINFPGIQIPEEGEMAGEREAEVTERTFQLVFEHVFYHGPFPSSSGPASRYGSGPAIALVETKLKRFSPDQEGLENLLEEIPELKDSIEISRIRLDGTTDSLLEIPAFEYSLEDGKISAGGLKAEVVYSLVSGAVSGSYDMQSVEFSMPEDGSMSWQGLSGEFDLEKVLPMLYVGAYKAVVGEMEMTIPHFDDESSPFTMEEMVMTSNSSFDGKMVNIEQNSTFGGIYIEGEKYGPLVIDAEMKNLDAQALSDFQQQIIAIYKDASSLDPDALAGMVLPMYLDLFGKLLAGDPEMNIKKFSLVTPKGDAEGSFNLKFSGIEEVSFDDPMMLLQYVQNVDASADLSLDEELVRTIMLEKAKSSINEQVAVARLLEQGLDLSDEQIEKEAMQQYEQQLAILLAQNYIVREEGKLKTSMTFKQGELMVNGQVLPIF
ncbi:MAG: YdgA family protein [Desulfuromonadales bacterium]|nr:YdgA family protein [Desulfuromonadales bacterium]